MKAPVDYYSEFVSDADEAFVLLRSELDWERRDTAPRCEYYSNDTDVPYTYGRGAGIRTYETRPWHPVMLGIRKDLENKLDCVLDVCFLNLYLNSSDWLGWHADDSPEMDDERPIVTVSLGAERSIQFKRPGESNSEAETLMLGHGSAAVMNPGMQDEWEHRIPKVGYAVEERISLTFRGFVAS